MDKERLSRRGFLTGTAVAGVSAVAGCIGAPTDGTETNANPILTPREREIVEPPTYDDARFGDVYQDTIDSVAMVHAIGQTGPIGQGSGFVYAPGYLITNEHVIRDATYIEVQFPENYWSVGDIIGTDRHGDLAVIEVEDPPFTAEPIEPSQFLPTIGQEVLAIGNPFGLDESVSQGIVSGTGRSLPTGEGFSIPDTIQTDASVNPGNSGGPLISMEGRYLGVITARQGQDIGFAISWRLVERIVPALIEDGNYDHSFMGIYSRPVTPAIAEANDLEQIRGVLVVDIVEDSPSEGNLQGSTSQRTIRGQEVDVGGDVIIALDGNPIGTSEELSSYLALHTSPGDELDVTVIRDGEEHIERIELGIRPPL